MQRYFGSLDLQTSCSAEYEEPASEGRIAELFGNGPVIARGAGVSYVGASFGANTRTIGMSGLNRVTSFDAENRRVTVEAGISLGALYEFLVPHQLYLPVQPGHPQITVGGCVACNVHGKNPQRDGVFADMVEGLELFHPDHGLMALSRTENPELFELTCGGFGLTGVIIRVTLRLTALPAPVVEVRKVPVRNLEDAFEQVDELKSSYDFLYTWNDIAGFGKTFGRGYVCCGKLSRGATRGAEKVPAYRPLPARSGRHRTPKYLFRPIVPWITRAHFRWTMQHPTTEGRLCDMLYPGMYGGYYYFEAYGANGFFGYMPLIPKDRWRQYVGKLEKVLRTHQVPMVALVIKAFSGEQRLLHFNGTGFSVHCHVPNTPRGQRLIVALEELSDEFGAVRTVYFDSRLTAARARAMYPEYEVFKQRLHRFDPKRVFVSALSRRLDL